MRAPRDQDLRAAFAEWMRSRLGYSKTETKIVLRGKAVERHIVGIHGQISGRGWQLLNKAGFAALIVVIVIENSPAQTATGAPPSQLASGLGALSVGAFVLGYVGRARTSRHAWVECRDAADPLQRRDVARLHAAVADALASDASAWKPHDTMLVSGAAGFTPDALTEAKARGVTCYQRTRDGFERVG